MLPKLICPNHQSLSNFTAQPDHESLLASWLQAQPQWQTLKLPHPDCFLVNDSRKAPSIEQIRAFLTELSFPPHQLAQKIFIIWRLDEASIPAQNALLKAFEEPPERAQIVATVRAVDQVLPTLRSRSSLEAIEVGNGGPAGEGSEAETGEGADTFDWAELTQKMDFDPLDLANWSKMELERVVSAADQVGDRQQALAFCRTFILHLLSHQGHPNLQTSALLRILEETQSYLRANCHVGLTMTNLFISLWQSQIPFGKKG